MCGERAQHSVFKKRLSLLCIAIYFFTMAALAESQTFIGHLLPIVCHELSEELQEPIGSLSVHRTESRAYSKIWWLKSDKGGMYVLKWSPNGLERENELTRITRKLFSHNERVLTPKVCCQPTPETFLVEALPGQPLLAACHRLPLFRLREWFLAQLGAIRESGTWLATFHASSISTISTTGGDGLRKYVKKRESIFQILGEDMERRIYRLLEQVHIENHVRIHGDYSPHNILVTTQGIGVIDFAGIQEFDIATPWFDVATLIVGIQRRWHGSFLNYLRPFPFLLRKWEDAFFEGYGNVAEMNATFKMCVIIRHLAELYSGLTSRNQFSIRKQWDYLRLIEILEISKSGN